jgi:hypothetical protein
MPLEPGNLNEPELSGWHLSVLPRLMSRWPDRRNNQEYSVANRGAALAGAVQRPYMACHRVSAERLGLAAIDGLTDDLPKISRLTEPGSRLALDRHVL